MSKSFNPDQKAKLTTLINEGIQVLSEIEDLNGSLNDTVKAVAEELEIKPSILKKAIKIAQKSQYTQHSQDNDTLHDILTVTGKINN